MSPTMVAILATILDFTKKIDIRLETARNGIDMKNKT